MIKEIIVKVGEETFVNVQVFSGERSSLEMSLIKIGAPVWRFIEGTHGLVAVSTKGEILRRYPSSYRYQTRKDYYQFVQPKPNSVGYMQVSVFGRNTCLVHRLVAEAFLPAPEPNQREVDHINQDKQDNRIENLRWVTRAENMKNVVYHNKPQEKTYWRNIQAVNKFTGEKVTFSSFTEIVPFAKGLGWGRGWGPCLFRVLEKNGYAYGYYWSGEKRSLEGCKSI